MNEGTLFVVDVLSLDTLGRSWGTNLSKRADDVDVDVVACTFWPCLADYAQDHPVSGYRSGRSAVASHNVSFTAECHRCLGKRHTYIA